MRATIIRTLRRFPFKLMVCTTLFCLVLLPIEAQNPFDDFRNFRQRPTLVRPEASGPSFGEFTFARTIYDSPYGGYRRRGMRAVDFPEADNNLIVGLREWALRID